MVLDELSDRYGPAPEAVANAARELAALAAVLEPVAAGIATERAALAAVNTRVIACEAKQQSMPETRRRLLRLRLAMTVRNSSCARQSPLAWATACPRW